MEASFSAAKSQQGESQKTSEIQSDTEKQFLAELTSLSQKYRLGIAGDPVLFLMEWDDDGRIYNSDSEGHLLFR